MFAYVTTPVTLTVQELIFQFLFITFWIDMSVPWFINEMKYIRVSELVLIKQWKYWENLL